MSINLFATHFLPLGLKVRCMRGTEQTSKFCSYGLLKKQRYIGFSGSDSV